MVAGKKDIYIEQGATFRMLLTLRGPRPSPEVLGPVLDLTGYVFTGQVRKSANSDIGYAFSFDVKNQAVAETKGKVEVIMVSAVSSMIPVSASKPDRYAKDNTFCYDIESTQAGGDPQRWLEGLVQVSPEATK